MMRRLRLRFLTDFARVLLAIGLLAGVCRHPAPICSAFAQTTSPQPKVEVSSALESLGPHAAVDWGLGVLEARGCSSFAEPSPGISAAYEARRLALEHLKEAVYSLQFDAEVTVGEAAARDPALAAELSLVVSQADVVAEWLEEDGRLTAVARGELWGASFSIALVVLRRLELMAPSNTSQVSAIPGEDAASSDVVVIDARDLGLRPCLLPGFYLPDGQRIQTGLRERARGKPSAPIRFVRTSEELGRLLKDRDPLYFRPQGVRGDPPCDIVLEEPARLDKAGELLVLY